MTLVVLVHGAHHGSWCWRDVVSELDRRGVPSVAPDLPCDDAGAGLVEYRDVVVAAIDGAVADGPAAAADDILLVGHSLGGLTIPLVAEARPVRRMLFLCSVPTGPGPAVAGELEGMATAAFMEAPRTVDGRGAVSIDPVAGAELFFHDCPPEVARWAAGQLRPQGPRPLIEPMPLTVWPDVAQSVVLARDDRVVRWEWAVGAASRRLGHEPVLVDGSHSPFLSRPVELVDVLLTEAAR